jgi:hypothetical protein
LAGALGGGHAFAEPTPLLKIAAQPPPAEAAYLVRLPAFVQWPDSAFESPAGPFNLCILAGDALGEALDQMVSGQKVQQHPVQVKRLQKLEKGSGCHVLYLGALKGPALADALAEAKDAPVLTVTEAQDPSGPKGVIDFQVMSGRVRLAVDQGAARSHGLVLSSKLLDLADSGRRRRGDAG